MTHCCVAEYDSPSHVYKASSSSSVELRELSPSCDSHYLCPLSVSPICVYLCPHLCHPHLCFPPLIHLLSPLFDNIPTSASPTSPRLSPHSHHHQLPYLSLSTTTDSPRPLVVRCPDL